ncbi:Conserved_hypothetical protein [Hexamita inflata]|uniref:Uncharacterized protein n=1 Tax=Hexamita inflata TaxID=28002 RepID=A0AA86R3D4_9EUKA|nr:Conserved hypothetical protein [Hexamita inflata]
MNQTLSVQILNTNISLNNYITSNNATVDNMKQNISTINSLIIQLQKQIQWLINKPDNSSNFTQFKRFDLKYDQLTCNQIIFVNRFEFNTPTYTISSIDQINNNLFGTEQEIKNIFIVVKNNTFSSQIYPIFTTQSYLYNIKIQFANEILGSGSILTNTDGIIINQLNINSETNSCIKITAGSSLNMFQLTATQTLISNLKVNLTIEYSQGNFGLIGSVTGMLTISNYQIVGSYSSEGCVAFIALLSQNSQQQINSVNLLVSQFNVGNSSSYLLSIVNGSDIALTNILVQIQDFHSNLFLNSIITTAKNYYLFGGLLSLSQNTQIVIQSVIYDCSQQISPIFVNDTGFMIGRSIGQLNSILCQKICFYQVINNKANFNLSGIFGRIEGSIELQQSQIFIQGTGFFCYFGTFGEIITKNATVNDVIIAMTLQNNNGFIISPLIAHQHSTNCTVINVIVQNSNIQSGDKVGGILGHSCNQVFVQSVVLQNVSIKARNCIGGIIGQTNSQYISILNSSVLNSNIEASSSLSAMIGSCSSIYFSSTLILISNCTLLNDALKATRQCGSFVGFQNSTTKVIQCQITNINITSVQYAGGISGFVNSSSLTIQNTEIASIIIICTSNFGITIGYQTNSTFAFETVSSIGMNYINDVQQLNCPLITDISINSC